MIRVLHVAGARPNFMKVAPLLDAFSRSEGATSRLVHTGQHYDRALSRVFFEELGIPRPDVDLGIGSGSHARQTAGVMTAFEDVCLDWEPDLVIVVGDVNSTLACALVAAKLGIPVAHVEAGLRSFDRAMPEEINRVVTDHLSELLFTTEPSAGENLRREGIAPERIHFVGNVMIDTLRAHVDRARALDVPSRFGVERGAYTLATLHRPSNVDRPETLRSIVEALAELAREMPLLFPLHPRTRGRLQAHGLEERLGEARALEPLGYLDFLGLMEGAALVITDSGGIQEETTALGVPCLTVRENTERPVTLTHGTNRLVAPERSALVSAARHALRGVGSGPAGADGRAAGPAAPREGPELWDGGAAARVVRVVLQRFGQGRRPEEEASGRDAVEDEALLPLHR